MNRSARFFSFALYTAFALSALSARGADMQGGLAQSEQARRFEYERRYTAITQKSPTLPNLLKSLETGDASGLKATEVTTALDLLQMRGDEDRAAETIAHITSCFEHNSYGGIRVQAAQTLLTLDTEQGARFARRALDDGSIELDAKLLLVESLVNRGYLFGYPFVAEGFQSGSQIARRVSRRLLDAYRQYDGQDWSPQGGKIDIAAIEKLAASNPQG